MGEDKAKCRIRRCALEGASTNPPNRYESLHLEPDEGDAGDVPTQYYRDASRSVLAENDSPDVGFRFSLNPYRGCEHGCVYCLEPGTPVLHADMGWRPIGETQRRRRDRGLRRVPAHREYAQVAPRRRRGRSLVAAADAPTGHRGRQTS